MNVRLSTGVLILGLFSFIGSSKPGDSAEPTKFAEQAIELSAPRELTNEPPDVLTATNLQQWKSLIRNLKPVASLPKFWETYNPQGCVILKSKGQSIVYKMQRVSVMLANTVGKTGEILEADICTPKMDIVETRELGLKIYKMFGFDPTKFEAWCKSVGTEWLDTPVFYGGDHNHMIQIRHSFNQQQPWVMHFIISPEKAYLELIRELDRQVQNSQPPSQSNTNELVAIALKTHTREAWLNVLYQEIEADPNIDEEMGADPVAGIRAIGAMTNFSSAKLFRPASPTTATNKLPDAVKVSEPDKRPNPSK